MPLIRDDDLERIELPAPGEWVEVKRRPSRGDEIKVQQAVLAGAMISTGGELGGLAAEHAIEAAEFATLDLAIKAWSFEVRVTPEAIRQLDPDSIEVIKKRLNELWAPRSDDEQKNSSVNGATPHKERVMSLRSSPGS